MNSCKEYICKYSNYLRIIAGNNGGVQYLHPVPVNGQGLVYCADNPLFDLRIHCVPHDRLQVRVLGAAHREEETLVVWVELPQGCVLRV